MSEQQQVQGLEAHFKVAAQVVFRLGEELITDAVQAVMELVKNAFDADATRAWVRITTPDPDAPPGSDAAVGCIEVEDNGVGMNAEQLQKGWLTIARSPKAAMKAKGETTKKARTPLGDKGLGRLGVQRLGHDVCIVTRTPGDSPELRLTFNWRDFQTADLLKTVPVELREQPRSSTAPGTLIRIRDLKQPEQWDRKRSGGELQRKLAELLSPFEDVPGLEVSLVINGERLELARLTAQVREAATIRYRFEFDGEMLTVWGAVRLSYLTRAGAKADKQRLEELIDRDEGAGLFRFLQSRTMTKRGPRTNHPPNLTHHPGEPWALRFRQDTALEDLADKLPTDPAAEPSPSEPRPVANPGPFRGELDYILIDGGAPETWSRESDFKAFVGQLAGIRIYRNGFGVRVDDDWLKLKQQSTSASSLYGLRPGNTIGYVAISTQDNAVLLETTSREGFRDTPHFTTFFQLMQRVTKLANNTQGYLRRSTVEWLRLDNERRAKAQGQRTATVRERMRETAQDVDQLADGLTRRAAELNGVQRRLARGLERAQRKIYAAGKDPQIALFHTDKVRELDELRAELSRLAEEAEGWIAKQPAEDAAIAQRVEDLLTVLEDRHTRSVEEAARLYETAALGLTAEALSHEIATIADGLARRAATTQRALAKTDGAADDGAGSRWRDQRAKVLAFVNHARSSVAALRRQLRHLHPALRYARERREVFSVAEAMGEVAEFYGLRLNANHISMEVRVVDDFSVRMNRGKFNQVFDNLILNSEYWLKERARRHKGPQTTGAIHVEVRRGRVNLYDDGPGVAKSIEDRIFQPFVSAKREGRGLGLYIIAQLLDSVGCDVTILPERNAHGRLFKFSIDLSGVRHDLS